jgi:hypothetical protein
LNSTRIFDGIKDILDNFDFKKRFTKKELNKIFTRIADSYLEILKLVKKS